MTINQTDCNRCHHQNVCTLKTDYFLFHHSLLNPPESIELSVRCTEFSEKFIGIRHPFKK